MASIDYESRIPNNVDLGSDRRLQRALEKWQPAFLDWWQDMGPEGFQADDIYLRTAVSTEPCGRRPGVPASRQAVPSRQPRKLDYPIID